MLSGRKGPAPIQVSVTIRFKLDGKKGASDLSRLPDVQIEWLRSYFAKKPGGSRVDDGPVSSGIVPVALHGPRWRDAWRPQAYAPKT